MRLVLQGGGEVRVSSHAEASTVVREGAGSGPRPRLRRPCRIRWSRGPLVDVLPSALPSALPSDAVSLPCLTGRRAHCGHVTSSTCHTSVCACAGSSVSSGAPVVCSRDEDWMRWKCQREFIRLLHFIASSWLCSSAQRTRFRSSLFIHVTVDGTLAPGRRSPGPPSRGGGPLPI